MKLIKVASAVLNQTPLDWEGNRLRIEAVIKEARDAGATVLCLPELCVTGYGCEDTFYSDSVVERAHAIAQRLALLSKGMLVGFGVPIVHEQKRYNGIAVAIDGKLRGVVLKRFLADDGIHYEPRWFKPWACGEVSTCAVAGESLPIGDIIFEMHGVRIGYEICRDAWVAQRPAKQYEHEGVDLILNPSASHFAFGKHETRKRLVLEGSQLCSSAYLFSNLLGCESGRTIYDGDAMIASNGEMIAYVDRFSFRDSALVTAVVSIPKRSASEKEPVLSKNRVVVVDDCIDDTQGVTEQISPPIVMNPADKHLEFLHSVTLGLFDYSRKSKTHGFVVSLSGGVDSSAVSCLVALMIKRAVSELGVRGFIERYRHVPALADATSLSAITKILLACVYQATNNSSERTHTAAEALAKQLGATWYDCNVQEIVDDYQTLVEGALQVKLSWDKHDTTLQNIQARVRSPLVWMIANMRQALLLATSNRSEASVGYTTMDGDSSGGLAPLGGIDKAYLREWLVWLEHNTPEGGEALSTLRLVNVQDPTAELRPLSAEQKDEDDLMPYRVLDKIERYAIRDYRDPISIYRAICEEFDQGYSHQDLARWVERFFTLWSRNQWKRERYAPSFHLDDESVDPKTFCRFPILSGGFDSELKELRAIVRNQSRQR